MLIFFLITLIRLADWYIEEFDTEAFSVVVYQLSTPLKGTSQELLDTVKYDIVLNSLYISLIPTVMILLFDLALCHTDLSVVIRVRETTKHFIINGLEYLKYKRIFIVITIVFLTGIIIHRCIVVGVPQYIREISQTSTLYDEEYIDPDSVSIQFPDNPRNLIYIYMESMESSFADVKNGGIYSENYIPELTQLAEENINFSSTEKMGGFHVYGIGFTMAGLLATTSGVNYKLAVENSEVEIFSEFMPGITSLGDILYREGYHNYFQCGSFGEFAGRDMYFKQHGNYEIFDLVNAWDSGDLPAGYYNKFWGYEDLYLYEIAKKKLTETAGSGEPFNYTMLTVDTHFPEGYVCELCKDKYDSQYANALSCASRQLYDFIAWAKDQDWYDNTTIIITGDHTTMAKNFRIGEDIHDYDAYQREVYNCFINCAEGLSMDHIKKREFSTCDIFPTVIAALGADIEGERLALGTNLFSGVQTIPERIGKDRFNEELQKRSKYYTRVFVENK